MSFFTVQEIERTLTIRNKKRISLICPLDESSMIIFYQDSTYEHRQLFSGKIIHEGKLQFIVQEIVKPLKTEGVNNGLKQNISGRSFIGIIGNRDDGTIIFGILNISSLIYQPYEVVCFETKRENQFVRFHLLQTVSQYPVLVMVSMNVQNGIMIQGFDFQTNLWIENVLYLGSRFLSYLSIVVPLESGEKDLNGGLLMVANGDKSESVHMACLSIRRDSKSTSQPSHLEESFSQEQSTISQSPSILKQSKKTLQFAFTREVKYFKNFTILGGHITPTQHLFFIGNSTLFETKEKKVDQCQAQCLWMNFSNLLLNNNLDPMAKFIDLKNLKIGKQIIVRQYLGCVDQSMIFLVQNPHKRSLHKLSPNMIIKGLKNYDEQIYTFSSRKPVDIMLSCDSSLFMNYELVCEQYFQKIKDSPSVIKLKLLRKIDKKLFYHRILQKIFAETKDNQNFVKCVIDSL